jgi:hypothetical protein
MALVPLTALAVKTAPLSVRNDRGYPQVDAAMCRVRSTSGEVTVTNAREATHKREWSSMTLRTSKTAPSATAAWVTSACEHSLGKSASNRMNELLGRLWGWGVTNPLAFSTRQMVGTDGTTS